MEMGAGVRSYIKVLNLPYVRNEKINGGFYDTVDIYNWDYKTEDSDGFGTPVESETERSKDDEEYINKDNN